MERTLKPQLVSACRQILRPIARLLLRGGVTWKEFSEVAKWVFIEVATREFGIRGRPTNMARVALLTGINRREVSRQREQLAGRDPPVPTYLNAAQRVLSGWHHDPDYADATHSPLEIALAGTAPSFEDLCRRYAGDMPATALLRELRKVGAVEAVSADRVRALMRTYIQNRFDPEKILRAGSVLEDIGNTIVHDLTAPARARLRFERRAETDRIDVKDVPAFQDFLEREGMAFLECVDEWLTRHEVSTTGAAGRTTVRLGAGVFHIQDEPQRGAKQ